MQPLWKTVKRFLKNLKIELPHDPAFPLLIRYQKKKKKPKTLTQRDICTPMFITIARIWKHPGSNPSTNKCKKKIWYIYTVEYYSAIKKSEILPFSATWMDLKGIMLSEISQTEEDNYCVISLIEES